MPKQIVNGKIMEFEYTPEEITTMQSEIRKAELMEKSRPLSADEVNRLFITQNINTIITDDKTASRAVEFHPVLKQDGSLIPHGTRINWQGQLKRAAVDVWDTAENNPDHAPALWEDINYRNGFRVIPETITAGTAFSSGEYGWWGETLYQSTIDNNVWTPVAYPSGWKITEL